MKPFIYLAIWGLSLVSALAASASAEEAKKEFKNLDALLNSEYQAVRKSVDESWAEELRDLQRKWISYRDYMAAAQPRQNDEGDLPLEEAPSYWEMKTSLTQDRIDFLKAWSGRLATPGITGTYRDFFGGEMTLRETNGGLEFTVNVVRGPTSHLGEIAGVAQLKGEQATYSDGEAPPAKLDWSFEPDGVVNVTEQNTDQYHGARAYFRGQYFKVSSDVPAATD